MGFGQINATDSGFCAYSKYSIDRSDPISRQALAAPLKENKRLLYHLDVPTVSSKLHLIARAFLISQAGFPNVGMATNA